MAVGVITGFRSEARILSRVSALVEPVGGNGARAYAQAMDLVARGATRLLSAGIAGGLDPALATGTVVVGRKVRSVEGMLASSPDFCDALGAALPDAVQGVAAHSEFPIDTALAKRSLYRTCGALTVDMESWAVAKAAVESGVPFAILRVVADPAARSLPSAALVGLDEFGNVHAGRVIRALIAHPTQLAGLIRVGLDTQAALGALRVAVERAESVLR